MPLSHRPLPYDMLCSAACLNRAIKCTGSDTTLLALVPAHLTHVNLGK